MDKLFEQFIQSGLYLRGWSVKTPIVYRRAFTSFQQSLESASDVSETDATFLSKAQLEAWVVLRRQAGMSAAGINIYIRAMNSFCSWLKENGHVKEQIKLKQLKSPSKPITIFSRHELDLLLSNKPKRQTYLRTWLLTVLMLDTGCRIDEVLNLRKTDIDFDNLLITVLGKGQKTRRIPFSYEMRKHFWKYSQKIDGYLFGTRTGTRITYRNAYRGMKLMFGALGIHGAHVHPHTTRHTFACNYVKQTGNIFALSRLLGHSSVSTTQVYLRGLQVEELKHHSPIIP
jgi:site-specific recombinase XerD